MADFWKSSGYHLLTVNRQGHLEVTADFIKAYLTRPEVHPVEDSCDHEIAVFEKLMADPFVVIEDSEIAAFADADAQDNYRVVLGFKDLLIKHKTIESAYLHLMKSGNTNIPPVFIDQMVCVIVRNILTPCHDPIRVKAGELFFREQSVTTEEGRIMLADDEIVEMYAKTGGVGALGQLLVDSNTPMLSIELDVLSEDSKEIYWERSDRFDTVIDLRFTQPALDAFARVIEAWIKHFYQLDVKCQPRKSIEDEKWSWHIGMDVESTRLLNALYREETLSFEDIEQIIALFRLEIIDQNAINPSLRGRPIYLGLAMTRNKKIIMKPQNLLLNLPLIGKT